MPEEMITVSVRIPKSQVREIEELAAKKGVDKSSIIRELLSSAIREEKLKEMLEQLRTRKITVWKAAKIVGVTYREMLNFLKIYNVPFPLSGEELKREIEEIISSK